MKIRITSAIVGLAALILVVLAGKVVLSLAVSLICIVALNEFYKSISDAQYRPVKSIGYLSCLGLFLLGFEYSLSELKTYLEPLLSIQYLLFLIFIVTVFLLAFIVFFKGKYNIVDISLTFFSIFYITFMFSFIILTRNLNNGSFYIVFIFIGAWATDTFAYFSGRLFGKRKLIPSVSPKKTVEGAIGGAVGCALMTVLYGIYLTNNNIINGTPIYYFAILGLLCGVMSQLGDLAASSIKRFVNVKDFGSIMPGHGGALDRFDSILFCAPTVYFYLYFLILRS
ncbi:UNVERIFIED_CONTAM: phosphatidate cytidylyltransferase [Acetivibrio alkalicellulosi]